MKVKLLHNTPLWVCSKAIRRCWASEDKSDTKLDKSYPFGTGNLICGVKDKELIERVGNKNKHKSTLEHLVYTFDVNDISRACLQELARHRISSYSVKSTRYTLKELKDISDLSIENIMNFLVYVNPYVNEVNVNTLKEIHTLLKDNVGNDIAKYMLPEAYKTSLVMTINARSLQNFLELRSSKYALWEIRELALNIYNALPDDHKYLFKDCIATETN